MATPIAQFSGLASGIDSSALIDAVVKAREAQNDIRRADIDHLQSENDALEELNTKLLALDELIDKFRTANGGGIKKKVASSDPTVASATAGATAVNASYALTVTSVADTATASFDHSYASSTAYVSTAASGDVTVTVGAGADQVTITTSVTQNSTTLTQLAEAINADSSANGRVTASVVNIGTEASPDYRLLFNTLQSGTAKGSIDVNSDAAITELYNQRTIDAATNAVFSIEGIDGTITRSSNTVSDVISGVTFRIVAEGTTSLSVGDDGDSTASDLKEIIDAYNEIVEYINENDTVERVEDDEDVSNVYGSLAKTHIDNDFLNMFRDALSSASSEHGLEVTSMAELGLATNRDGTIDFDEELFASAVDDDAQGATEVLNDFADTVAGISGYIYEYTKLDGFIDTAQEGNNNEIDNLNEAIDSLTRRVDKLKESMQMQFTRLETTIAKLQSQQQSLSSALASLG